MNFLTLCLTALICWGTPWRTGLPADPVWRWVDRSAAVANDRPGFALYWLGFAVLVPLILLVAALWLVEGVAYGLLTLILHVLVLLACVSRKDPLGAMSGSIERAWERGDQQAAALIAERDWSIRAENPEDLGRVIRAQLALEALRGYFVPAFWYVLLGPVAALGYALARNASESAREGSAAAAEAVQALDWLPLRLLGLSLAMVGQFRQTWDCLRRRLTDWDTPASQVASELIEASLGRTSEPTAHLSATRRLLAHALLVWAVFIAFLSLVG